MTATAATAARPAAESGTAPTIQAGFLLPAVLLVLGSLYPTSVGGSISTTLQVVHQILFCITALWIAWWYGALAPTAQVWNAVWIAVWCTAATVLSPFQDLAPGAVGVYVTMAALLCLDVSRIESGWSKPLLRAFTAAVLVFAAGVAVGNAGVARILVSSYSAAYPELLPTMMAFRKPVFTFASHSLAAFFYFLLFYLNLETYRADRRLADLLLAVGCIAGGFLLTSITALMLTPAAIVLLFAGAGRARWPLFTILALAASGFAWRYWSQIQDLVAFSSLIASIESSGSGLSGRFGRGGNLLSNVELIRSMPLRPVGVSFSNTVFYGDSGPVEYIMRGSWPLLLSVYAGLALFLWNNLRWRSHATFLFLAVVAFEIGMTVMTYHRFVYFLPFAAMHLNEVAARADRQRGLPVTQPPRGNPA